MSDFKNYLAQQMEDPAFAAEYEAQRPEYEAIRAVIAARLACNMTQKELAERPGSGSPISAGSKTALQVPRSIHWQELRLGSENS